VLRAAAPVEVKHQKKSKRYKKVTTTKHKKSEEMVERRCQNISLYEPEQSLSLSQDEGEQC